MVQAKLVYSDHFLGVPGLALLFHYNQIWKLLNILAIVIMKQCPNSLAVSVIC